MFQLKENTCGLKSAKLDDKEKIQQVILDAGHLNNKSDEMYKVANLILESDIIFFGSIRWGKMNAIYEL
jgi:hypothetical protein